MRFIRAAFDLELITWLDRHGKNYIEKTRSQEL